MRWPLLLLPYLLTLPIAHAASPITGGWHYGTGTYPDRFGYVLTLFEDGTYYVAENESIDDPAGLERGTYVWDPAAETITFTELEDSGNVFFLTTGTYSAELDGDTLTLGIGPFFNALQRVADPASAIVGSWYVGPAEAPRDDGVVITFLQPDGSNPGHYLMAEDGTADDGGGPGMELGDYVWDGANDLTIPRVWIDTTGDWGLSDTVVTAIAIDGDSMIVTFPDEGDVALTRVPSAARTATPVPVPGSWPMAGALLLLGTGRLRAAAKRSRRRDRKHRAAPDGGAGHR
jgi:hypothetical protein